MFCTYADTSPTSGALLAQKLLFWVFFLFKYFFFYVSLFLIPLPPPLCCQLTLWKCGIGWTSLMPLFEGHHSWLRKAERVFVISQSWSSQEEFPFLSSFALAVSQLSFLQISALVPSHHKNTCGSKDSETSLSGASSSCGISFLAFSRETFVPASVISH